MVFYNCVDIGGRVCRISTESWEMEGRIIIFHSYFHGDCGTDMLFSIYDRF